MNINAKEVKIAGLKKELLKAKEALETPEYKKREKEFEGAYQEALKEEDETGVRNMILNFEDGNKQYIDELRWEISDLEQELDHSAF